MKMAPENKSACQKKIPMKSRDHSWLVELKIDKRNYGNFGEDVKDESQDGKIDTDALATEALPQVFRHGVHTAGHVNGYEDPTQQDQDEHSLDIRRLNVTSL